MSALSELTRPARAARGPADSVRAHPDVVLVHDYLLVLRGAERTFRAMATTYPDAPIATLLYDEVGTNSAFADRDVRTSALQRLPLNQGNFRSFLPLFPLAAGRLPVQDADVVISSSSAFAHGVAAGPGAVHVSYCHSPFRYAWHERARALEEVPSVLRPMLNVTLNGVQRWDYRAQQGIDHLIANSTVTQQRIQDFWHRDARVLFPPVETHRFAPGQPEDFLLIVCELVKHKQVDVALTAARRAGRPVKVVGTGPDERRLRALHSDHAEFLGRLTDDRLAELYPRALAVVVPNVEEFGIVAVEAQAAGRPVIASNAGGTAETVIDGVTGILLPPGDVDAFAEAMRNVDFGAFSEVDMVLQAETFSTMRFQENLASEVERVRGESRLSG